MTPGAGAPPFILLNRCPRPSTLRAGVSVFHAAGCYGSLRACVLRLAFVYFPRPVDDDTFDYLQMGHNLFHYGVYGIGTGDDMGPSTYRLPGYPIFLATFESLFARFWPNTWFTAVFLFQAAVDLVSGLLLAAFARRHLSDRAAEVALALAMLCPFTAVYSAIAMTECFSVFAISLGMYAAGRVLAARASGKRDLSALILAGCAAALGTLLRPDGIFLFAAIALGLFFYTERSPAVEQPARFALRAEPRRHFYLLRRRIAVSGSVDRPQLGGLSHLSAACAALRRSRRALDCRRAPLAPHMDHRFR